MPTMRRWRLLAILLAFVLVAAACGGDDDDSAAEDEGGETETEIISTTVAGSEEESAEEEPAEEEPAEVAAPAGTLRMVEFSPVTTFDPARSQTAQSVYLYPVYDTLTRQNNEFGLEPSLATSWESPTPTEWVFQIRDDVTFHDGAKLDGQVVADNMNRSKATEGNPNGAVWAGFTEATATGDYEVTATFAVPQPQFPLEMSMVMGMMISPNALGDDVDLARNPQGSGPWVWSDGDSEAGVTEVYTLFEDYWNPVDQGVERVEITAVPDSVGRLNALLTGETDIMGSTRDDQIADIEAAGGSVISVPNNFVHIDVSGRSADAPDGELLQEQLIREAIAYAVDRNAYNEALHAGRGSTGGGVYPSAFADWHVPELDSAFEYDPDRAQELLAEAGYPDGITLQTAIMPAIQPQVEFMAQMLGASGITLEFTQINNGELGPRARAGEWGLRWARELLYHPAATYPKYAADGVWNPYGVDDIDDLSARLAEAAAEPDLPTQQELYSQISADMINQGVLIPLTHGAQNGAYAANVSGVVMGLNMQSPMPYGVRVDS